MIISKHWINLISSLLDTLVGVFQGSVVAPLLFLVYMNDSLSFSYTALLIFLPTKYISVSALNVLDTLNILNAKLDIFYYGSTQD